MATASDTRWSKLWRVKPVDVILRQSDQQGHGLKRTLGAVSITAMGIGAIVGTGIFVLTGVAAAKYAGPGLILSFVVAAIVSGLAAICYAEFASTVPIAGSAYTYSYATLGELIAWIIGWDLILEYAVGAAAVSIGWSGYFTDLLKAIGITLPNTLTSSPFSGGIINLPAMIIILLITGLLIVGTSESSRVNNIIVAIKLAVILFFLVAGFGHISPANWNPFLPFGVGGIFRGASIIFFAYIGFDQISTSAEEARNPGRDMPIGIISSLVICTILYILVTVTADRAGAVHPAQRAFAGVTRYDFDRPERGSVDHLDWGDLRPDNGANHPALRAESHLLFDGTRWPPT